jgi:hypothetical protein
MRNWAPPNSREPVQGSLTNDQFGIASLPGGRAKVAATLGGRGYAISRHSLHPREASMLVRFLCRRHTQLNRSLKIGKSPTIPELYNDPRILADPYFSTILKIYRQDRVSRPSTETGKRYPALSRAYFMAVHEVLAGKKPAATALADLQTELMQITGLNAPLKAQAAGPNGGQLFWGSSRHATQIRSWLRQSERDASRNVRQKDGTRDCWALRDSRTSHRRGFSKLLSFRGVEDWAPFDSVFRGHRALDDSR